MNPLNGRRVVLGVSGGIAAYKAVEVCRRLVDGGAHVIPVMTDGARRFVGEVTFSALASEKVRTSLFDDDDPIPHTTLGQTAEVIVVAPATARLISAYATGYSSDLLTATLIATRAPVVICPAMHTEMWEHPAVQENLATLRRRGVIVVDPEEGRLAGGDVGAGRLAGPERIVAAVTEALAASAASAGGDTGATGADAPAAGGDLTGLRVLVSAGGTREAIDPVRFLGNRSSGKQGHAIAEAAALRGATVALVTTTSSLVPTGIERLAVESAQQMHDVVLGWATGADVVIMAAAVADFRPVIVADQKIKKDGGPPNVVLESTPDILAALGKGKRPGQTIVGFAAETFDLRKNAAGKLARKGADLIVANDVSAPGVGFEHDTNAVVILTASGREREVALADKRAIADVILDEVLAERSHSNSEQKDIAT